MKKVTAVLLGAGDRGMSAYGSYALANPDELQFVAVAEPRQDRRKKFQELHGIKDEMAFANWQDLLDRPQMADAVLICTWDRMHFQPTVKAIEKGYHILLEKPISTDRRNAWSSAIWPGNMIRSLCSATSATWCSGVPPSANSCTT